MKNYYIGVKKEDHLYYPWGECVFPKCKRPRWVDERGFSTEEKAREWIEMAMSEHDKLHQKTNSEKSGRREH
ncbi:hypothetical protein QEH52_20060 [Coraliomargarita sp. SDUM461003]|uniref:Uncharacterized protein n=1 Tax=Thalassobacterium maritimum TaxID=3041265 RepID=A0ABU1B2K8_9BACT|nr:hypothetical protein [Coraliomargarita sp. SDUM461003]MDQ8209825.1 hypothetical protein [Coraliomargarita sp. SDUM461003]